MTHVSTATPRPDSGRSPAQTPTNWDDPHWDVHDFSTREAIARFEQTPLSARGLPHHLYDFISRGARVNPDGIAQRMLHDVRTPEAVTDLTHRQFLDRITQSANLFHRLGATSDRPVSLLMPESLATQYTMWGAASAAVAHPLNWMLGPKMLGALVRAAGSRVLVVYGGDEMVDVWDKVEPILAQAPGVAHVVLAGGDADGMRASRVAAPLLAGKITVTDLEALLVEESAERLPLTPEFPRDTSGDVPAMIFGTGGTTGAPKLAIHTHRSLISSGFVSALVAGTTTSARRLNASPSFHVLAAVYGHLTALAAGSASVIPTTLGWRGPEVVDRFWRVLDEQRITHVSIIPTIVNQILRLPLDGVDLSRLMLVGSGSAPLSEAASRQFYEKTSLQVRQGWGLTESGAVSATNPRGGVVKDGSIGLPFPYTEVTAIRSDLETTCEPDEQGELVISGPGVFAGYADPAEEASTWTPDGHLRTGDLGRVDSDGYVWITGRLKDIIVRGGHNIDPRLAEEALFLHPDVVEAVVVAGPDAHAGEIPVAFVVPAAGATVTEDELRSHTLAYTAERAAVPRRFHLVAEVPKTGVGKILKTALRSRAAAEAVTEILARAVDASHLTDGWTADTSALDGRGIRVGLRRPESLASEDDMVRGLLAPLAYPVDIDTSSG